MALATSIQFVHLSVPRDISEMVRDINVASWTALGQMVMILSNAMVGFHTSYKFVEGEIFNRVFKVNCARIFLASRQLLIGPWDSRHLLDQSDGKVIHQTMTFSRVRTGCMKRSFFAYFFGCLRCERDTSQFSWACKDLVWFWKFERCLEEAKQFDPVISRVT